MYVTQQRLSVQLFFTFGASTTKPILSQSLDTDCIVLQRHLMDLDIHLENRRYSNVNVQR